MSHVKQAALRCLRKLPDSHTTGNQSLRNSQFLIEQLYSFLLLFKTRYQIILTTLQVPLLNLAVSGIFSAIIAFLFDLEKLVEFMSIGTLLAYTIVSASVIILRYKPEQPEQEAKDGDDDVSVSTASVQSDNLFLPQHAGKLKHEFWWLADLIGGYSHGEIIPLTVVLFTCGSVALCVLINFLGNCVFYAEWTIIVTLSLLIVVVVLCLFIIGAHKQNPSANTFRVPWVPLIPGLSILCNVGLMVHLNALTWVRFAVWMILGLLVYFLYGIEHSKEADQTKTYSMLITSTEAHKEHWGAIKPRGDSIETKVIKEQGVEVSKEIFSSSKKNEQDFST